MCCSPRIQLSSTQPGPYTHHTPSHEATNNHLTLDTHTEEASPRARRSTTYVRPCTHHVPRSPSTSSQRFKRSGNRCTYPRLSASPSPLSFTLNPNLDAHGPHRGHTTPPEPRYIAPHRVAQNQKVREAKSGKPGIYGVAIYQILRRFFAIETCWGE